MNQTRREFIKNIFAIGIGAATIPILGSTTACETTGEHEIVWSQEPDDYYKQAEFLIRQVSALEEKSRGGFNPHKAFFYIALPQQCIDDISAPLNRDGWRAMDYFHQVFPFGFITDTHDIRGVPGAAGIPGSRILCVPDSVQQEVLAGQRKSACK